MRSSASTLNAVMLSATLLLSGCGSEGEERDTVIDVAAKQVYGAILARRAAKTPRPPLQITPKQLANTKVAALQVNPIERGGGDVLRRIVQRRDNHPGTVSVWRASDGAQLIVRGGVLVGSRGVRMDILSSEATPIIRAIASAGSGQGERRYVVSNGDYTSTEIVLSCSIENLGSAVTQVVNLRFQTVHIREDCIGGDQGKLRITNDYWVQPESGLVRRSKQWSGPISGYFELILLKS